MCAGESYGGRNTTAITMDPRLAVVGGYYCPKLAGIALDSSVWTEVSRELGERE